MSKLISILKVSFSITALLMLQSACGGEDSGSAPAPTVGSPSEGLPPGANPNSGWLKVSMGAEKASSALSFSSKAKDRDPDSEPGTLAGNGGKKDDPKITSINITIIEVAVYEETTGWYVVTNGKTQADLMSLSQNAVAVLANNPLKPGNYTEIRLKIEPNATAVVDGKTQAIKIPSAAQSGIKLKGKFEITKGYITSISLNFDPEKSIIVKGNRSISVKPVINIAGVVEDFVAPTIAILSPNLRYSNQQNQTLLIEYFDQYLLLDSLSILINGTESKSTFKITEESAQRAVNLQDGYYKIEASISDLNKNLGSADPVEITIDTVPPLASFQQPNVYFNTQSPQLSFEVTDASSGLHLETLQILIDNQNVTASFTQTDSVISGSPTLQLEGQHTIKLSIQDRAGNLTEITGAFVTDITPPVLGQVSPANGVDVYTNTLPYHPEMIFNSNEPLLKLFANGFSFLVDGSSASGAITLSAVGSNSIVTKASDLAGNEGILQTSLNLIFDNTPPSLAVSVEDNFRTNASIIEVPIKITDSSPTFTDVSLNGVQFLSTGSKDFVANVYPSDLGNNQLIVKTTDAAGNVTEVIRTIVIDRTPPSIQITTPLAGSLIKQMSFQVTGKVNEPIQSASVNGMELSVSSSGLEFSGTYVVADIGDLDLDFRATDIAGNEAQNTISVTVGNPLLWPQLISVRPSIDNVHLIVKGAPGAARSGAEVNASTGFFGFNDDEKIAKADGSFILKTKAAGKIKISARDLETNETFNHEIIFDLTTSLAGVVLDTDGNPVPGATVQVFGTNFIQKTDGTGAFEFKDVVSGDQQITIDGTTASQPSEGNQRFFSKTSVRLSIGLGQINTLQRPIYLGSMAMDGSGTPLVQGSATVVTSPDAPGVALEIPADVTTLPATGAGSSIFIKTIPASRATIAPPLQAEPTTVLSLEPSGTTFAQRVQVTLPNENELPPGTELIFLSMNSKTGQWEIDGRGQVTSDGNSVQTNPGEGISHFSLVYAIPLSPIISEVGDPNVSGIDVSKGSLTTSISLPSFKSLGQSVTPQLIYKSSWAKPTAFVSNRIDIPKMKSKAIFTAKSFQFFSIGVPGFLSSEDYLVAVHNETVVSDESMYIPDMIKSQTFIGSLKSGGISFVDSTEVPAERGEVIAGPVFAESVNSNVVSMTGIPNKATISYAVPLKDEESGEYLANGIYPYIARYEIRLKRLTLRTVTSTSTIYVDGDYNSTQTAVNNSKYISAIQTVLPQDVAGTVLLKNRVNSEFGRGWDSNLTQRIANPNSQRLMIEEANGDLSTYALESTVSTLMIAETGEDLGQAVSVNWPFVSYVRKNSNNEVEVVSRRLDQNLAPVAQFKPSPINFQMANQNQVSCPNLYGQGLYCPYIQYMKYPETTPPQGVYHSDLHDPQTQTSVPYYWYASHYANQKARYGSYNAYRFPASLAPSVSSFHLASDGSFVYTNPKDHSIWRKTGNSFVKIAGQTESIDKVYGGSTSAINVRFNGSNYSEIQNFCRENFGQECGQAQHAGNYSCIFAYDTGASYNSQRGENCGASKPISENKFCSCTIFEPRNFFRVIDSVGGVGVARYAGDDQVGALGGQSSSIGFNNPGHIVPYYAGTYLVADTGNNRIRLLNLNDNTTTTFAGDGSNFDQGDGIDAKSAKIYHPKNLLVTSTGDVYFTSERGYVRKIDTTGTITVVGGLPAEAGGVLADEGPISTFALNNPGGMAFDETSNALYIADTGSHRIIKFDLNVQRALTVAGSGECLATSPSGTVNALNDSLCSPTSVGLDDSRNLIIVDSGHGKIKRLNQFASANSVAMYSPSNNDGSIISKLNDGSFERIFRNGNKVIFNSSGLQIEDHDLAGKSNKYSYDSNSKLIQIEDSTGSQMKFSYTGNRLGSVVDPANRQTNFFFSGDKLTEVSYPDGSNQIFVYDDNGLLIKEINGRGAQTKYAYNQWDRLSTVTDPVDHKNVMNDWVTGTMTNNHTNGSVGQFQSQGFGPNQTKEAIVDVRNISTEIVKDHNGLIWKVKNSNGEITSFNRDSEGRITRIIKPDGSDITMSYDPATGDVVSKTDNISGITETFTYNKYGQLTAHSDGKGNVTTKQYDLQRGYLLSENLPGGIKKTYSYNPLGLIESITEYPTSDKILIQTFSYDQKGNVSSVTYSDGKISSFSYDAAGNILTKGIGSSVNTYEYDSFNRLTKVKTPNGESTEYTYSLAGELTHLKNPNNKITSFTYDLRGQLLNKTLPDGYSLSFVYDAGGNVISTRDPNGNVKTYTYDSLNRIEKIQYPDDLVEFAYDSKGNVIGASNHVSNLLLSRDLKGRVTEATTQGLGSLSSYPSVPVTYTYNDQDQVLSAQSDIINLVYEYDVAGRLSEINDSMGCRFKFYFDSANRLNQIDRSGGYSKFIYSTGGNLSGITHYTGSTIASSFIYETDDRRRIVSKNSPAGVTSYTYDSNDQILNASVDSTTVENFSYDGSGNLMSGNNGSNSYDDFKDKLVEDSKYSYAYDKNGNLILKSSKAPGSDSYRFDYNSKNQLKAAHVYSTLDTTPIKQIYYSYDVLDRRIEIKKYDNSMTPAIVTVRRFVYDGNSIIGEYDGSGNLLVKYTHSPLAEDDVLSMHVTEAGVTSGQAASAGTLYYLKDHLGSITEMVNPQGFVVQRYEYSAFGKILKIGDESRSIASMPIKSRFTFTGREFEEETGLYYYRARNYDPQVGRFIQRDPEAGLLSDPGSVNNSYAYVKNSPTHYTDPTGRFWDLAGSALIYGTIGERLHLNTDKFASIAFGATVGLMMGSMGPSLGALAAINFSGKFSSEEIAFANKVAATLALSGLAASTGAMGAKSFASNWFGYSAGAQSLNSVTLTLLLAGGQAALMKGDFLDNFLNTAQSSLATSVVLSPISNAVLSSPNNISPAALKISTIAVGIGYTVYNLQWVAGNPDYGVIPR